MDNVNNLIKKESEKTASGLAKHYDIFEKTRFNKTFPKMHTHSYYEILLVNDGELTYKIELDTQIRLYKGEILFVPPFVPHATYREHDGMMRCTVVKFSTAFLLPADLTRSDIVCLLNSADYSRPYYLFKRGEDETDDISALLMRAYLLVSKRPLYYETALRGELSCLLAKLLQNCENSIGIDESMDIDTEHSEILRFVLKYVRENYQYPISMDSLARECDMSYYAFSRLFKQMMGKSFSEYLLDTRLSFAQKKLLSDNISVSQIASECGFEYVSYFIKRFKQKYGVTPLEYRKMYKISLK